MKIKTNLVFGIVALVCGAVVWILIPSQIGVSTMVSEYVSGRFIPRLMAVMMMFCGAAGIIKSLVAKESDVKEIEISTEQKNVGFLLLVVIYGILAKNVSFLLASLLFSGTALTYVGCRDWKKYGIVFGIVAAVCVLFKFGLKVQFGGFLGI